MKLSTRDAAAYFKRPDQSAAGCLIFGQDAVAISQKRRQLVGALLGENAEAEMRLSRLNAAELRSDGAALLDAVKAVGFFPGPRAVVVDGATDGLAKLFTNALADWQDGDAQIIISAGQLAAKSSLRKLFEGAKNAYSIAIYDDPPTRGEIADWLSQADLAVPNHDVMGDLETLARSLPIGDFRQVITKLGLYKYGDKTPISAADIDAVAPLTRDAALDDILNATAEAETTTIGPLLMRLAQQGTTPISLCIAALRHFKALHAAACHPGGAGAGLQSLRPPVFGPRRDRMLRQINRWDRGHLETALSMLLETDLTLRSASVTPQMALMERTLIRLAMLPGRGRRQG